MTYPAIEQCDIDAAVGFLESWEPGPEMTHVKLARVFAARRLAERERIVAWLRGDGSDQANEDLCQALWSLNKVQRKAGVFIGSPYFELFADAIERGEHMEEPKPFIQGGHDLERGGPKL